MKYIYDLPGVSTATGDACAHNFTNEHGIPLLKRHLWLSNGSQLLHAVGRLCPGHRSHASVSGASTKASGIYTNQLANTILSMLRLLKKQQMLCSKP